MKIKLGDLVKVLPFLDNIKGSRRRGEARKDSFVGKLGIVISIDDYYDISPRRRIKIYAQNGEYCTLHEYELEKQNGKTDI